MSLDQARLAKVMSLPLWAGAHQPNSTYCVMEAVAFVAGESWSDAPACTCPVIGAFMRSWNDGLPTNDDRDRLLKPLIPKLIGTRASKKIERRRSYMALDWLVRVFTPEWLDLVPSLHEHAKALREHEEIADLAGATAVGEKAAAAGAAAGYAAWDAAWDAAGAAAWAAAGYAAGAAAWDAARAAAWAAARAAAEDALAPTTKWLQASAVTLVERMCDLHE
jgi:hypothetical protein